MNNLAKKDSSLRFHPVIHLSYFLLSFTFCFLYYYKVIKPANFNALSGIDAVLSFSTFKPFQYRLLIPFFFKILSIPGILPPKILFLFLSTIIVYFIIIVYRLILEEYFPGNKLNVILAVLILYPMTWNYVLLNQLFSFYDFSSILFYTLAMYYVLKERYWLLIIVFIVGMVNKETIAFIIFAFVFYNYKKLFKPDTILKTSLLVLLFVIFKAVMFYIFRNNPGNIVEIAIRGNMEMLRNLFQNYIYAKNIFLNFGAMYIFAALLIVKLIKEKEIPGISKEKIFINFVFIIYLLMGIYIIYFTEVRVYSELMPMLTTLFIIYLSTFEKLGIVTENIQGNI